VVLLAKRAGLHQLIGAHLDVTGTAESTPATTVVALIAGMIASADNINKMDLLRPGAIGRLFTVVRAPRHSGRSCGRSPSATCANSTRSRPGPWLTSAAVCRCWSAPTRWADDGGGHGRLVQQPGQRHICRCVPELAREVLERLDRTAV